MDSAHVVGLVVVLALQVALHIRIACLLARATARFKSDAKALAYAEADTLQEVGARRVRALVASLKEYHDHLAELCRAQIVTAQQRPALTECRHTTAPAVEAELRALVTELRTLQHRWAAPERRTAEDELEQRKTVEVARPPASCTLPVAPAVLADRDDDDDEETPAPCIRRLVSP